MIKNDCLVGLLGVSAICLAMLIGGYFYSGGQLLPTDQDPGAWIFTILLIAIPGFTFSWLLLAIARRNLR